MKFFKNFFIKVISNIFIFLLNKNKIPNLILNFNIKINATNNTFYHQEGIFKTDNNFKIPIYSNYRYSIKKGWKIFDGLNKLETLSIKKLLTNSEETFLKEAVGNRQINKSISEINEVALRASKKNEDLFFHNPYNVNSPILKPNLIDIKNKFYIENGGHSLCTSDSPWGHILLNKSEFRNYLKKYRKYEFNTAISWLDNALYYENTQKHVQLKCLETGFNILNWYNSSVNRRHLNDLTKNIIQECLIINDNITLEDLLTENIYFIAQKPQ